MTNEEIYKIWTEFINSDKYKEYFISNENSWKLKLNELKKYIDDNNKRPSTHDKNKQIKDFLEGQVRTIYPHIFEFFR